MSSVSSDDHKEQAKVTLHGVAAIEAVNRVWTPLSKTFLFIGWVLDMISHRKQTLTSLLYSAWRFFLRIALVAYVYSLDGSTSYLYLAFATSSFQDHSLLSSISVAQAIILAVAKPPSAKIADDFGRAQGVWSFFVSFPFFSFLLPQRTSFFFLTWLTFNR